MLHVGSVLQHFNPLCCTWYLSCNILTLYVARGVCLATFQPSMLHVVLVLQYSNTLYCTWYLSCNILTLYIARGTCLATSAPKSSTTKKLSSLFPLFSVYIEESSHFIHYLFYTFDSAGSFIRSSKYNSISSSVFPFVSYNTYLENKKPITHIPANIKNILLNPMLCISTGKNNATTIFPNQLTIDAIPVAIPLASLGNSSPTTIQVTAAQEYA